MTRKPEKDLYKAYCNLCFYTDTVPLFKYKWKKQFFDTPNRNKRTVKDIQRELDELREYA